MSVDYGTTTTGWFVLRMSLGTTAGNARVRQVRHLIVLAPSPTPSDPYPPRHSLLERSVYVRGLGPFESDVLHMRKPDYYPRIYTCVFVIRAITIIRIC